MSRQTAAIIAAVVSALIFFGKWLALEKTVSGIDTALGRMNLASPTPLIASLNEIYPYLWFCLAAVVALVSAFIHGRVIRHPSLVSVAFGSVGVPGAILVVLWAGASIFLSYVR